MIYLSSHPLIGSLVFHLIKYKYRGHFFIHVFQKWKEQVDKKARAHTYDYIYETYTYEII